MPVTLENEPTGNEESIVGEAGQPAEAAPARETAAEEAAAPPAKKTTRARKRVTSPRPAPRSDHAESPESAPDAELADSLASVASTEEPEPAGQDAAPEA